MSYYKKYNKYKSKYNAKINTFYNDILNDIKFFHATNGFEGIKKILKSGKIKLGSHIKKCLRKMSGGESQDFIFANIYFNDIQNLSFYLPNSFIINSKIINDYTFGFNKNWKCGINKETLIINKNDPVKNKINKIIKIKDFVINLKNYDFLKSRPGQMHHEIIFMNSIDINKYITAIICKQEDKEQLEKLLKKYNYKDIKIITLNEVL